MAAAANFFEVLMRADRYVVTPPLPMVPGVEMAGVVEAAGEGADLATYPGDIVDLYTASGAAGPSDYTYVITDTGKTFYFDGTRWLPQ